MLLVHAQFYTLDRRARRVPSKGRHHNRRISIEVFLNEEGHDATTEAENCLVVVTSQQSTSAASEDWCAMLVCGFVETVREGRVEISKLNFVKSMCGERPLM